MPYSPIDQTKLTQHYELSAKGAEEPRFTLSLDYDYAIDFVEFTETNERTGKEREIRGRSDDSARRRIPKDVFSAVRCNERRCKMLQPFLARMENTGETPQLYRGFPIHVF